MRIEFIAAENDVGSREKLISKLGRLAIEAKTVLGLKIDKTYVPPGREPINKIENYRPSYFQLALNTLWWSMLYQFAYSPNLIGWAEHFRLAIGGQDAAVNLFLGNLAINGVFTFAIGFLGLWAEFEALDLILYIFMAMFGGFSTVGPVVKLAFRNNQRLDSLVNGSLN